LEQDKQYLVIKMGGSMMSDLPPSFFAEVVALPERGVQPVIVHGGGPLINKVMEWMAVTPAYVEGLRVTDEQTLDAVKMALAGKANKDLVGAIARANGLPLGISGADGRLITVKPVPHLGLVGDITHVDAGKLMALTELGYIPVMASLGMDEHGTIYNINADTAAGEVAAALGSRKLVVVTNVPGIYVEENREKRLLSTATEDEVETLIAQEQITGGMIPKVRAALKSLHGSVEEVVILHGGEPRIFERLFNGEPVGTVMKKEGVQQ
jgi:acetylglutamate kinase